MEQAYKKYKTEIKTVKTGGGKPAKKPSFFDLLDLHLADDVRINGIEGTPEAGKNEYLF